MKQWRRLLAALLAALLICGLPLAALAEPVIEEDDGLDLVLEEEALEIEDGLEADVAGLEIDLAEAAPLAVDLALLANEGEAADDGFDIEDGVVVGYHGEGGDIVIPERATAIGPWSFYESPIVTGVTIPGNIQEIGEGCFQNCPNLTRVTIGEGVAAIRNSAFQSWTSLTKVTVPGSVKLIGNGAFNGCSKMNKLTLGNGIEDIGMGAFNTCSSLTKLTIPGSVRSLGYASFQGYSALTSLTIQEGVVDIDTDAFMDCTSLKSVTIPGSVKKLESTFKNCSALEKVTIKAGLEYLYDDVFGDCVKLKSVTLPNTLKHIGQGTFYGCVALKGIKIPESVESLESYAFGYCNGLTNVTIPAGVKEFEGNPFIGCKNLKQIVVAKGNTSFVYSDGLLYTRDMKTLICCVGSRTSATIADGVKTIGDRAFEHCDRLKEVSIPAGVKHIGEWAFEGDTALQQVWLPVSVTEIGENAFIYEDDDGEHPLKAVFIVEDGSYAQKYAKKNGLAVRIDLSKAKVTVTDQVVTGKALKPAVTVVLNKKTLRAGTDYKVAYKANKAVGAATVTVTGVDGYAGTATGSFAINPKPVKGLKLEAGAKRLTASWKKGAGINGYQLEYSLKKNFASSKKSTVAKAASVKKVIKGLQSGKRYYVRIRAYGKVNGKTYWSAWSDAQSVKVK